MEGITFDVNALTAKERKLFNAMNDQEKESYQKLWIRIQEYRRRLKQLGNASKSRIHREIYSSSKKERKERAHRLIERGAIMEAYIDGLSRMNSDEVKEVIQTAASNGDVQAVVQSIQSRKEQEQ